MKYLTGCARLLFFYAEAGGVTGYAIYGCMFTSGGCGDDSYNSYGDNGQDSVGNVWSGFWPVGFGMRGSFQVITGEGKVFLILKRKEVTIGEESLLLV
ncbi:MAG: hypothetical protein QM683_07055 [Lacrimispora sp.]